MPSKTASRPLPSELARGRRQLEWATSILRGAPVRRFSSTLESQLSLVRRLEHHDVELLTVPGDPHRQWHPWHPLPVSYWYAPEVASAETLQWALQRGCSGAQVELAWRRALAGVSHVVPGDAFSLRHWVSRVVDSLGSVG